MQPGGPGGPIGGAKHTPERLCVFGKAIYLILFYFKAFCTKLCLKSTQFFDNPDSDPGIQCDVSEESTGGWRCFWQF